jgi:hypothetical protein
MPGGTATKLRFSISPAPAAGKSASVTIRKNGTNTTLTCTITGDGVTKTCSELTQSVTFSDDDKLSILFNKSNFNVTSIGISLKYAVP